MRYEAGQPAFALRTRTRPLAPRFKCHGRMREGGSTGSRPAKRPVLGFKAGGKPAGVVGGAVCLPTRAARAPVAMGVSTEGGGPYAVGVGVARTVGVARAGVVAGPPAKHKRIGRKVPQAEGSSSPQLG